MQVIIKYGSMSTSKGMMKNGDIVDLPADEVAKIAKMKPLAIEILPELPVAEPKKVQKVVQKVVPAKRKRARNSDGTLKADDPSTPDVNEAWEDGDSIN